MKHRGKLTLITLAAIVLQGCGATHAKFTQKYNSWVGKNISYLISAVGYPDSTFTLPSKNKVYVYEKSNIYSTPSLQIGYGMYGNSGLFGYGLGSSDIQHNTCKLFIETNKRGKILKWQARGNHCVEK